jgi:hypothetical protein
VHFRGAPTACLKRAHAVGTRDETTCARPHEGAHVRIALHEMRRAEDDFLLACTARFVYQGSTARAISMGAGPYM